MKTYYIYRTVLLIAVLLLESSPCAGQFGAGEMMGGGMGEGFGGAMSGMGGLAGMMGGTGGGGIGAGIGNMVRQGMMTAAVQNINEAVHFIVGPEAAPDAGLLQFAMSQGGPPQRLSQLMGYIPHMQRIARDTYRPWLIELSKRPVASNTSQTSGAAATKATTLTELEAMLDSAIMQRAVLYGDRMQGLQGQGGGQAGGAAMASIGAMIPMMVQGITAQFM